MRNYLISLFRSVEDKLNYLKDEEIIFSAPQIKSHGDLSTNIAMRLAKKLKRNPREIASEIISNLEYDEEIIESVEIAGPGFINFIFSKKFNSQVVKSILDSGNKFGQTDEFEGLKANVEFVSANPTGPLTVGHGRGAVIGDTVANMLEWLGYEVDREYYFNNAGRQMRVLGDSVKLRYLEILGQKVDFPDDYYQGEYIKEIAKKLFDLHGPELAGGSNEGIFKDTAEKEIFSEIKSSLAKLGIKFKNFFNEKDLYDSGRIEKTLNTFREENLSYEQEGAVWFKFTKLGSEQDKVIVKSSGEPTYRLPDIAYHETKFERGYDRIIDIFGSDHAATYPDVLTGLKALGYDVSIIDVLIHQFVTILQQGELVKMSTRKANFITLDELVDEVGADVVRYFFIMRNMNSHLNFDIDLAKKQSDENPVFYLQYAHARICSILRMVENENLSLSIENLDLLTTEPEQLLLKKLSEFSYEIKSAALSFEPHKVANYLEELASLFHKFYTECRIIGSEKDIAEARVALITAVKSVLKNGLALLGLTAPDRM